MAESPFPGMDPYLESDWLDVHSALITYIRDQVQEQLPDSLCARMESRILVEGDGDFQRRQRHPDVRVVEPGVGRSSQTAVLEQAPATDAEPDFYVAEAQPEPVTQRFIQIIDAHSGGAVITTIELVSPSNKRPGAARDLYLAKRKECHEAGVNTVEIDLTRGGDRLSIMPVLDEIEPQPTYVACVRRPAVDYRTAVYLMPLDRPLRRLRVPLRRTDEDAMLDLQPLVRQAYIRGRYDRLDYSRPLDPPPSAAEAGIVERFLRRAGKLK